MPHAEIEALARTAARLRRPLLFLDTCTLLDLVRVPTRARDDRRAALTLRHAHRVLTAATRSAPELVLVVAELVREEYRRHIDTVIGETRQAFAEHDRRARLYHAAIDELDPQAPTRPALIESHAGLFGRLADDLIAASHTVPRIDDCELRAHRRNRDRRPPGRRGDQSQDCEIVEHCLEVCRAAMTAGHALPRVLVTSNKRDYCRAGSDLLDPDLEAEFRAVGLGFALDLDRGLVETGLQRLMKR